MSDAPPLVVLFGPTALGKTEIATALAERLGAEIVSADSMQVYRGLAILTNHPDAGQLARVRRHLIGYVDPQEDYSVAQYAACARDVLDGLRASATPAIIEGGSGLYVRAALGGLDFAATPADPDRAGLELLAETEPETLIAELARRDPGAAERLDADNPRRLIRAVEAARAGSTTSPKNGALWSKGDEADALLITLEADRDALMSRVDTRVVEMVHAGLVAEVELALGNGPLSRTVRQAIGVSEALGLLAGDIPQSELVARIQLRTRRLVKRQLTWMRKLPDAVRIPTAGRLPDEVADEIMRRLI